MPSKRQTTNAVRLTLLGVGALNSPRYTPAGLLVEFGSTRVMIDGGPGSAPRRKVSRTDGKVIVSGNVRSWMEKDEAETSAWAAPGVTQVTNQFRCAVGEHRKAATYQSYQRG